MQTNEKHILYLSLIGPVVRSEVVVEDVLHQRFLLEEGLDHVTQLALGVDPGGVAVLERVGVFALVGVGFLGYMIIWLIHRKEWK